MPKRILVVEEDDDVRLAICDRLLSMGFEVVSENSGRSALLRISLEATRSPIQGVLLDLQIALFENTAVLRELRDRHPQIPVVVMLAFSDTARLHEARNLGARTYVVKPFDRQHDWERISWLFHNG
ncbi:response regulator [Petrachloros mirabilis]